MCRNICMRICVYVYVCVYIYIYVNDIYIYTYIYIYIYVTRIPGEGQSDCVRLCLGDGATPNEAMAQGERGLRTKPEF